MIFHFRPKHLFASKILTFFANDLNAYFFCVIYKSLYIFQYCLLCTIIITNLATDIKAIHQYYYLLIFQINFIFVILWRIHLQWSAMTKKKNKKKTEVINYFLGSYFPSIRNDILCHTNLLPCYNLRTFCYTRWNNSVRRNLRGILKENFLLLNLTYHNQAIVNFFNHLLLIILSYTEESYLLLLDFWGKNDFIQNSHTLLAVTSVIPRSTSKLTWSVDVGTFRHICAVTTRVGTVFAIMSKSTFYFKG